MWATVEVCVCVCVCVMNIIISQAGEHEYAYQNSWGLTTRSMVS